MLTAYNTLLKWINALCEYVTIAMLVVMTVVILFQVVCRAFGVGFDFTEELGRYLMVGIVTLGAGIAVHRGGNIGIEFLVNAVSPGWRRLLAILMNLCCLFLFFETLHYGWRVLRISGRQVSPSMQLPMSVMYGIVYAGMTVIFLHLVAHLLALIFPPRAAGKHTEQETSNI